MMFDVCCLVLRDEGLGLRVWARPCGVGEDPEELQPIPSEMNSARAVKLEGVQAIDERRQ